MANGQTKRQRWPNDGEVFGINQVVCVRGMVAYGYVERITFDNEGAPLYHVKFHDWDSTNDYYFGALRKLTDTEVNGDRKRRSSFVKRWQEDEQRIADAKATEAGESNG